jgi:hypothetical protein
MILATDGITGRVINQMSDLLGRWTHLQLAGRNGRILNFITAYQVCPRPTNKTGTTAFHQQESLLRTQGRADPNPRRNFRKDLTAFLKPMKFRNEHIILAGDFNEPLDAGTSNMSKICQDIGLSDVFAIRHPETPEPATYIRGSKRIDYFLVSASVLTSVEKCGYDPFQFRLTSDHRGMFLDINTESLFGNLTQALAAIPSRLIRSKEAKSNTTYINEKYDHLEANNFFNNIDQLIADPLTNKPQAERLDNLLGQASIHAGNSCRKRRRDWWSQKLTTIRSKCHLLQRLLSGYHNKVNTRAAVQQRMLDINLDFQLPVSFDECKAMLKVAQNLAREVSAKHTETRLAELDDRAETSALDGNQDKTKHLKQMASHESTCRMYSKIRTARGQNSKNSQFTSLQIPKDWPEPDAEISNVSTLSDPKTLSNDPENWRTVELPSEIMYYLRLRNRLHFGQAQGTPFTIHPLRELVDWEASSKTTELILEGDYSSTELNKIENLFLQHCKRSSLLDSITDEITEAQFVSRMKSWRESTTTSPSGIDLGHYKAMINPHSLDLKSVEGELLETKRKKLISAHVSLINYAIRNRFTYERWKTIVNVMIQKEPGNNKIHRLRVIHIYEADFNGIIGIKWKQLLHQSTHNNAIHTGQHGARPGHEATTPVFMEELKNDIAYASRKALINFDNDATSCYDRIIPALASLLGRRHGLHRNIVFVHARTLKEAKYKLKTVLGVSDEYYSHCEFFPIYGTGQGSANSPVIWTIVSSVLFEVHESQGHGAHFTTPDQQMSVNLSMVGFVDDSTGQVNDFLANTQPTPEQLASIMQHDAQLWSNLLWISGGLLELPKCSYHHIHFDFDHTGKPFMRGGRVAPQIMLTDNKTGTQIPITSKSVFDPHKTLGHKRAPGGKGRTQEKDTRSGSNLMGKQVSCSPLNTKESRAFYDAIYLKSVGFVLPNSYFSEATLNSVQTNAMGAFVPKCGYSRSTSRAVIFGPTHLAGAGFTPLYLLQGEGQILQFLKYWRTDTPTSRLLRIAVSWCQFQAGTSTPILTNVTTHLPHLESRWIPSLRQFLCRIQASIELDLTYIPPKQRIHDEHIMDHVISSGKFTNKEITQVNYCRMHLQVTTVSDVCQANGTFIDEAFRDGNLDESSSSSKWLHVNQPRPSQPIWSLWTRALSYWFDYEGIIHKPLGPWILPGNQLRRTWPSYYDSSTDMLYIRVNDNFRQYDRPSTDCEEFSFGSDSTWQPNSTSLPVTTHKSRTSDEWTIEQRLPRLTRQPTTTTSATFSDYLAALPKWEIQLFDSLDMFHPCYDLIDIISANPPDEDQYLDIQLLAISDGSAFDKSMSFGWSMSLLSGQRLATCAGPVPGSKQSSFRAEGYGLLSITRFIHHLFIFCGVRPEWKIQLSSDNDPLIQRIATTRPYTQCFPNSTLEADWDVVHMIVRTLQDLPCIIRVTHVKGHQDDHKDYEDLPLDAQLNCDADHEAVQHQTIHATYRPRVPRIVLNTAQLHILGATINSGYKPAIRNAYSEKPLLAYIQSRNSWSDDTMAMINLQAHQQALSRMSARHTQLVKLCHDLMPTARITHRYNPLHTPHCFLCKTETEDLNHLLRCTHPDRKPWQHRLFTAIRATCEYQNTRSYLVDILIDGLSSWLNVRTIDKSAYPSTFHRLIREQTQLGWRQLFQGRMSKEWARLQDVYLRRIHSTANSKTGLLWTTAIITTIWKEFFLMWEARNTAVHGKDSATRHTARIHRATVELQHLHKKQSDVLATDRNLFIGDTPQAVDQWVLSHSATHIENWLRVWKPVIIDSAKAATAYALQSVRPLQEYFTTTRAPTPSRRPPKPRYTKNAHTVHDRNRVRKKRIVPPPARNHSILAFFTRRSTTSPIASLTV